ncbi:Uma2 family endonuclease [Ancylobacter terrae]|uniref:Uma2 family endonuclease n=1 Tax=Ancylobacter sp. sgz301288 TaxID=3342077 RepID=UPI00385C1718
MNIRSDLPMTKEAFLRWAERQEETYEYVRGRPVMMVRVTRNHGLLTSNLLLLLRTALPRENWNVFADALGVDVGESLRCPDLIVEPAGGAGDETLSAAPVLIAEILSPSSLATDLSEKPAEYTALPSLLAYVVLAQNEARLWLWQRGEDGTFPHAPEMIDGTDAVLPLAGLGLALPLAAIYEGVA